jgi:hypothetical protein
MTTSQGFFDFFDFKRKRSSSSSTSSITPEKQHSNKKTKGDPYCDIEQESDSILAELDESITSEMAEENSSEDIRLKKLFEQFDRKLEKRFRQFTEDTKALVSEVLSNAKKNVEKVKTLEEENKDLRQEVFDLKKSQKELKIDINRGAQHSRKDNCRIWKLEEKVNEDTREVVISMIRSLLRVDINREDISACHRLPPGRKKDEPKPILVKWRNRCIKELVMKSRKLLKGKRITISDDITRDNMALMDRAKKSGTFESVWFFNGKVHAVETKMQSAPYWNCFRISKLRWTIQVESR